MKYQFVTHYQFMVFVTAMAIGVTAPWLVVDTRRLLRALGEDRRDPVVRDRIFGALLGLVMCSIGFVGAIAYWL